GVHLMPRGRDALSLQFANESIDGVWVHAIRHHLGVPAAASELRRVPRPEGVAVLCDPGDGNLLVRAARRWLSNSHTDDEQPLRPRDLASLREHFRAVELARFPVHRMLVLTRYVVLTLRPMTNDPPMTHQ